MHAKFHGTAADAIDAEDEVKHRPEHGHEPDDADPKRGGAGITFVQQGMAEASVAATRSKPATRCGQNSARRSSQFMGGVR
ncbi:MAG: hypothetical protein WDN00_13105 [Limisphaerales bacterium]